MMTRIFAVTASLMLTAWPSVTPAVAAPAEYLVTGAKPNRLFVIDMKARKVVRDIVIPGEGNSPQGIVPSPSGDIAYALVNGWKEISGIELKSGKEVFRASASHEGDERSIIMGFTVSPDGKRIFANEVPAKIGTDRYTVQPTRISIYRTDAGVGAKPEKILTNTPRRIALLMMNPQGDKLYALGWDFYTLDPNTGAVVATFPLRNWTRPGESAPDSLSFWPMMEASGIFSVAINYMRTDLPPTDPRAAVTALLTLDLKAGQFDVLPLQVQPEVFFTMTIAPNRRVAYGGFNEMSKIDLVRGRIVKRVPLDHSYYQFNISKNGREVYVGGTMCDIMVFNADTLARLAKVELPGCPDVGGAGMRMITTDLGQ
ncbi:quinohemoprotein amine dehydrogenase subunit beta [Govanella unica]|uniref:Quinohemoprotein amine dehydrogenase subunit beta n=1 Tax=Govanella unica TaxID=2975056 RepID=A0A9X3Z653_9PROT|nr:quinohemoprotein amine dehydrogenase subunit beta [Govania unica]MDA5192589.1 quinohemoprotein amine dehydrogenase subunit beta [Govania unica]